MGDKKGSTIRKVSKGEVFPLLSEKLKKAKLSISKSMDLKQFKRIWRTFL